MTGAIDFNTLPLINLIVIIVGIIAIIIVVAVVIKKFGLQISQGTLKASDYRYDQNCQTIMYHLQEAIENIDYDTRCDMRRQTKPCNYKIASINGVEAMCHSSRKSIFYALKEPLYDYINNNHFTKEFLPENYDAYRHGLIDYSREIYQELVFEYNNDQCPSNKMLPWTEVSNDVIKFIDDWLLMAMITVKRACTRKISEYEKVLSEVEKSSHWSSVVSGCIEKNNHYIECIRDLIEDLKQKREVEDAKRNSRPL